MIKKCISSAAAIILAADLAAVSAAAAYSGDREALKKALFEYKISGDDINYDTDDNYVLIEDNAAYALLYDQISDFVDSCGDDVLKEVDCADRDDLSDIMKNEWVDWYAGTVWCNEWALEYENGEYMVNTEDGDNPDAPYLYFRDSGEHWDLVDESGAVIDTYDKLYQFSYLNEEPDDDDSAVDYDDDDDYDDDSYGESKASADPNLASKASTARVTGGSAETARVMPASGDSSDTQVAAVTTTGRVRRADPDDDDEEESETNALPIILSAIGGIVVGAVIVTVIAKVNGKKK